ncbi:MAG: OsmC family protein [Pseudomonadota bacterium]
MARDDRELSELHPDAIFDGGDLDCGSGLILMIREHMLQVPPGGVLEMRSREPTVGDDLPPWCRMSGHRYLGALPGDDHTRYFVEKGTPSALRDDNLEKDKRQAREYDWRVRARAAGHLHARAYCRNFSLDIGQPVSFEEKDAYPSAVEVLLAALTGDLAVGFSSAIAQAGLDVDDVEITARGQLANVLAHLGLEAGDPSFAKIEVKAYASTMDDEDLVRRLWDQTVARSPLAQTLSKATELTDKLLLV